jgi:hypothetical protein
MAGGASAPRHPRGRALAVRRDGRDLRVSAVEGRARARGEPRHGAPLLTAVLSLCPRPVPGRVPDLLSGAMRSGATEDDNTSSSSFPAQSLIVSSAYSTFSHDH